MGKGEVFSHYEFSGPFLLKATTLTEYTPKRFGASAPLSEILHWHVEAASQSASRQVKSAEAFPHHSWLCVPTLVHPAS